MLFLSIGFLITNYFLPKRHSIYAEINLTIPKNTTTFHNTVDGNRYFQIIGASIFQADLIDLENGKSNNKPIPSFSKRSKNGHRLVVKS